MDVDEGNLARAFMQHPRVGASVERTEGTSISTRISPFAGRVTEATSVRKDCSEPNVKVFGPSVRTYNVVPTFCGLDAVTRRCPGDNE